MLNIIRLIYITKILWLKFNGKKIRNYLKRENYGFTKKARRDDEQESSRQRRTRTFGKNQSNSKRKEGKKREEGGEIALQTSNLY